MTDTKLIDDTNGNLTISGLEVYDSINSRIEDILDRYRNYNKTDLKRILSMIIISIS